MSYTDASLWQGKCEIEVHIDDNFDMVDVAMAALKLLLLLTIVLPMCVKLSVVVTCCVPISVDGGVGIHGLMD